MQNICDGRDIKHGSDFNYVCDAGHTVDPEELFAMRQNNRNGQPYQCVCAIYGIQFPPINYVLLGNGTETVGQIEVCVIYDIRFTRTNYFRLGKRTETVHLM